MQYIWGNLWIWCVVFLHVRNRCSSFSCMEGTAFFYLFLFFFHSFFLPPSLLFLSLPLSLSNTVKLFMWLLTVSLQCGLRHVYFTCYSHSILYLQISLSSNLGQVFNFFNCCTASFSFFSPSGIPFMCILDCLMSCSGSLRLCYIFLNDFCLLFILNDFLDDYLQVPLVFPL